MWYLVFKNLGTVRLEMQFIICLSPNSVYNSFMGDNQDLVKKHCVPCDGNIPRLAEFELAPYVAKIDPGWQVINATKIRREFKFKDFNAAMEFANEVAKIADVEGHHPELTIGYGKAVVEIWTHAIVGLSENDFILAAKIDVLRSHD